ncbi:MAG: glutamine--tRNA ligase/YqeY domain fusion protein [Chloroflexi bacterium]|nr:glutamine--tRNA ligase/YqeY domain fusion protein [Chloroflexota bacterium]
MANDASTSPGETRGADFIRQIVNDDRSSGRWQGQVVTRFPPEPNGYLHLGHAYASLLSYGIARENAGRFNLRFDDTNPSREEQEYVDAIRADLRWLGLDWEGREFYASDYFEQLYAWAEALVRAGKAFVCGLTAEELRSYRGTLTEPGRNSPDRDRSPDENLALLRGMRAGDHAPGSLTLRARIDMAAPNLNLRDPVMYRILDATHHRTGDAWHIYPSYDWAHGQSDAIEGVTHSLCSLEFEDHRPLYDWFVEALGIHHPRQIEFARFNLSHAVMSKRKVRRLVDEGHVSGWDDPRMLTLAGMRRRGYTPEAIAAFCADVGVSKRDKVIELARLEHFQRQHLNAIASRRMAVLDPLRVVITNWPSGQVDHLPAVNNPEAPEAGSREVPFTGELWIERDDFMEDPPRKFFRLAPGREVRLRYAFFITCDEVVKDADGRVVELRCRYDPATRGGDAPDGRKVKATLHWVSAAQALRAEVRLYDRLFVSEQPEEGGADFLDGLNPDSLELRPNAWLEPALADARPGDPIQFERLGYFAVDPESRPEALRFNRVVGLRDGWSRGKGQPD